MGGEDERALLRDYYARTAARYDGWHTLEHDEHHVALRHVLRYLEWIGAESVLDTGCGTGRALRAIREALPAVSVRGNDPSPELLRVASEEHGVPAGLLDCVPSERLPYADGAFDAVVETGVLHHVPDPSRVVAEMLRVARKAVFLSDSNVYGQGSLPARLAKLGLARAGLLRPVNRLRRGGRDWHWSEADGVAYSYSVYDSLPQLEAACAQVLAIPTLGGPLATRSPLLGASHVLLCAFKAPLPA